MPNVKKPEERELDWSDTVLQSAVPEGYITASEVAKKISRSPRQARERLAKLREEDRIDWLCVNGKYYYHLKKSKGGGK
jgi:hypothetical protein